MPDFDTLKPVDSGQPDFSTLKPSSNPTSSGGFKMPNSLLLPISNEANTQSIKENATGLVSDWQKRANNIADTISSNFGKNQLISPTDALVTGSKIAAEATGGITDIFSRGFKTLTDIISNNPDVQSIAGTKGIGAVLDAVSGTGKNIGTISKPATDAIAAWEKEHPKVSSLIRSIGSTAFNIAGAEVAPEAAAPIKTAAGETANVLGDAINSADKVVSPIVKSATTEGKNIVSTAKDFIMNKIKGKTAEQVIATPEAKVTSLTPDQQKLWYKNQADIATQKATEATQKSSLASEKSITEAKNKISDFNQKIGATSRNETIALKEPSRKLMQTSSQKYVELSGEAAQGSSALTKTVPRESISTAIDSKFEYNPDIGSSLKKDLGLDTEAKIDPNTNLPVKTPELTNQQLLDKAREIMSSVSKTARQGGKTYSFDEYQAIQKYRFIMEQLSQNGVDMSKANEFWKSWAPVRDRIIREIKPFDEENVQKMPFSNTLNRAASTAKTSMQTASKIDAQNFVSELEKRMKLEPGTIGQETRSAVEGLDKAKLSKQNIEQVSQDALDKIKVDKKEALKKMSLSQYNTVRAARTRAIIKKVMIGAGIWIAAKATGADKAILNTVGSVI